MTRCGSVWCCETATAGGTIAPLCAGLGALPWEARAVTIRDLRAAAALEVLPTRSAEAMEQLQRLCVACGVS